MGSGIGGAASAGAGGGGGSEALAGAFGSFATFSNTDLAAILMFGILALAFAWHQLAQRRSSR
jgi:hypothetical protein